MLMRIQAIKQFLLSLDLSADDGEVEHLDEMRYLHARILHDVAVLFVGSDRGLVVILGLHHHILELHKKTLCFAERLVRDDLLGIVRCLRTLDSVLQRVKTGEVCVG